MARCGAMLEERRPWFAPCRGSQASGCLRCGSPSGCLACSCKWFASKQAPSRRVRRLSSGTRRTETSNVGHAESFLRGKWVSDLVRCPARCSTLIKSELKNHKVLNLENLRNSSQSRILLRVAQNPRSRGNNEAPVCAGLNIPPLCLFARTLNRRKAPSTARTALFALRGRPAALPATPSGRLPSRLSRCPKLGRSGGRGALAALDAAPITRPRPPPMLLRVSRRALNCVDRLEYL